jgi:peptidoglycan/xylan/chitin deacetylase (PgdA/CDA1 family)
VGSPSVVRRAAKAAVLPAGAVSRRRRGDVVILVYHRVGAGQGEISLSVDAFARQLAHLVEKDRVLSLDQALRGDRDGGVVVTFDDGYRDFHDHVLPLVQRYEVPAVLYLTTGWVGGGGASRDCLTWPAVREAAATGLVTVGAHTHGHADLSRASQRTAEQELRRSKELVEDSLGTACHHFSYPWAVGSREADSVARRLFRSAAWDAWRTNRRGRMDPHRLGRTPVLRSDGTVFFRAKLRGLLDAEGLVYRAAGRGPWRPRPQGLD